MAVELPARRPRELASSPLKLNGPSDPPSLGPVAAGSAQRGWHPLARRAAEMLPGALALFLISTLAWGFLWFPSELAIGLLIFDVYWLWKTWTIGYHVLKGVGMMRRFQRRDWRAEYAAAVERRLPVLQWDSVRHVVLIPNYREAESKLRETLTALAEAEGAREQIIPVLAMEEAEAEARTKATLLLEEFRPAFFDLLVSYHPHGLPGEVRGKSANQAWAARRAVEELVDRRGLDIDHLTVTSCDADSIFPQRYFECLTYFFTTDVRRYRRFWQAPIFFYNNIWKVPASLRIPNALMGLIHLSRLSRKRRVLFSQSTYSLSLRMARDVGYWDVDVIPEDWHMFLKCFYELGGSVDVQPIHLPIGNDGALSKTTRATFVNQYLQVRRWGWGASDLPYALRQAMTRQEIPWHKRYLRFWYFLENHLAWSTQWFFINLGGFIPWIVAEVTGDYIMPSWFAQASKIILTPCIIPYLMLIFLDARLRPPPPPSLNRAKQLVGLAHWLAIPPISFLFSTLPVLDSQVRLMLGRRMEYRVTEKI